MKSEQQNLFIIGSPRSGTTFLASLLKPTKYGEPFETQFILKYANKVASYGDLTQLDNLTRLLSDISAERAIAQWRVPLNAQDALKTLGEGFSYIDVVDYICCQLMATRDRQFWGDKTPHYILKLAQLTALYPEAKYLYIVRDGRDVALSLLKKDWGPNNVFKCAEQWLAANSEAQLDIIKSLEAKGNLLYIRYEKLLADPKAECARIYAFLGDSIDNHADMVDELIAKTMTGNHSKWKTKMTSRQIEVYESQAKQALAMHGYEVINKNAQINTLIANGYKLHDFILWAKHMFVQNVIDGIKIKFFGKQPFNQ